MFDFKTCAKAFFLFCCFISLPAVSENTEAKSAKLQVVTSFSILQDLVEELGGDHIEVINLVGRNSDAHTYQPKPSDAVAISKADLIIYNGLEFEGWILRLLQSEGSNASKLVASTGVDAITHEDEADPHAWQSFKNIRVYIQNISDALIAQLPEKKQELRQLQANYLSALSTLEEKLVTQIAEIPKDRRIVVTSHDAFAYLGREYDIQFLAPHGVNLEVEATAADVAAVINQIRAQNVSAIFVENITNPRLVQRISDETQVAIGGSLYSDALSEVDGPASTYLNMMSHNLESLIKAFN